MAVLIANNATGKLGGAITTTQTSISLQAGNGAKFPSPTGSDWFPLTVVNEAGVIEIMACTGRSADVLTVERSKEGTAGVAFIAGDRVGLRITRAVLEDATLLKGGTAPIDISGSAAKLGGVLPAGYATAAQGTKADEALPSSQLLNVLKTVDGAGSGLDADKLDGKDSGLFAEKTDYASRYTGGTVKARISGSTLYIRFDGGNA